MKPVSLACCMLLAVLVAGCGGSSDGAPKDRPAPLSAEMAAKEYNSRLRQTLILLGLIKDGPSAKKRKDDLDIVTTRLVEVRAALKSVQPESSRDRETVARLTPEIQALENQLRSESARVAANAEAATEVAEALRKIGQVQ
jgi:predicted  nucleic acid-binding Zn-ribbon protein